MKKLFRDPATTQIRFFEGTVDRLTITSEGQERLHITYVDGDQEDEEVGNVIPWLAYPSGEIHLEKTSRILNEGSDRVEYLLLTMLDYGSGHLFDFAQELIRGSKNHRDLLSRVPRLRIAGTPLDAALHLGPPDSTSRSSSEASRTAVVASNSNGTCQGHQEGS